MINQSSSALKTSMFLVFSLFIMSCQTGNKQTKDKAGNELITNKVYTSEKGSEDASLAYAFVVPSGYKSDNPLPIIYMLDPHANGKLPVEKYAEIAEKQQVILMASNNIRNGMQQTVARNHFLALMKEAKQRFSVDTKQQFIAGFSGGAKLGILYAGDIPEIIGVIACGGSIPFSEGFVPNFYFAGIVGLYDFNYLELIQTQNTFTQNGFDFTSVQFNGGHEWAPAESFNLGVSGMKLYAMKSKRTKENSQWIEELYQQMKDSVTLFSESNQVIKHYETLQQMNRWFYGVKPITDIKKQVIAVERSRNFGEAVKNKQALTRTEVKLRTEYIRAIELKDLEWWNKEAEKLVNPTNTNFEARNVSYRLKNYISMVSFMLIKNALDNNNLEGALKKINIYELIDETNQDVYLMYARYYLLSNNKDKMVESFKKAIRFGKIDAQVYEEESSWIALFEQDEIKSLL